MPLGSVETLIKAIAAKKGISITVVHRPLYVDKVDKPRKRKRCDTETNEDADICQEANELVLNSLPRGAFDPNSFMFWLQTVLDKNKKPLSSGNQRSVSTSISLLMSGEGVNHKDWKLPFAT